MALAFGPEALQTRPIRIGTRGSRLALIQANEARDRLIAQMEEDAGLHALASVDATRGRITLDRSDLGGLKVTVAWLAERG